MTKSPNINLPLAPHNKPYLSNTQQVNISPKNRYNLLIVEAARSWLGTPFKLQGRLKGKGCDCLGLIIGISIELNLKTTQGLSISTLDQTAYHLSTEGALLEEILDQNLHLNSKPDIGNLALMAFDSNTMHLGILADHPLANFSIIHSDIKARAVVEHTLNSELKSKIKKVYNFT